MLIAFAVNLQSQPSVAVHISAKILRGGKKYRRVSEPIVARKLNYRHIWLAFESAEVKWRTA